MDPTTAPTASGSLDPALAAALTRLQDIPLPPPVSYRPATVGWVIVAALLLAAAGYGAWRRWRRWQADRYRRAALAELGVIESRLTDAAARGAALATLPALVKRTALACEPRPEVAGLTDDAWLAYLDRTCPPGGFASGPGRVLPRLAYAPAATASERDLRDLLALVRRWIRHHDARL